MNNIGLRYFFFLKKIKILKEKISTIINMDDLRDRLSVRQKFTI